MVLLHGSGTSGWMWERLVPFLDGDLHLLVVDLPGHGGSNAVPWVSLDDTAAAVAEVVRTRAHGGRAHVAGLSLGGYVATALAARRAGLLTGALVSGVSVPPFPHPRRMRLAGRLVAPFVTTGPVLRADARALRVPAEDLDGHVRAARTQAPGEFLRVGSELAGHGVPDGAATSDARVLAVAGEREHALVRSSLPVLAGAFPHGRARVVPGVGHAWNGEAPGLFADALRAHTAGRPLPPALVEP
ncbi:pimeloyl-ACP methyl ester carboxylesterase [Geodermatophilus bullaregiensis]|uniref:alpha/beta fold hydrolase n=1 Tax=Geodermatophilus bullaregiensis TaxID=1564160 RepID=UPI0019593457|nr:alpha/beta hydrolase [Geodermatophilus bullaregiensis]MBM7806737.1 pimeloyl-ACP methyl ester carboxylesterase [Geodermatophilus bullaregiensis]